MTTTQNQQNPKLLQKTLDETCSFMLKFIRRGQPRLLKDKIVQQGDSLMLMIQLFASSGSGYVPCRSVSVA
jgi:hypothetical protein